MLGTVLSFLCTSKLARAEIATAAMHSHAPLVEQARERVEHVALVFRRMVPVVSLVPALTLNETFPREMPPSLRRAPTPLETMMHDEIFAPPAPLFCHGPSCSMTVAVLARQGVWSNNAQQQQLGSTRFIASMGSGAAALLAYFCTPKPGHTTWRFGLVSAVGGPAFGLRVRW